MTRVQLQLIPQPQSWRLDATTRAVGLAGLAQARAALAAASEIDDVASSPRFHSASRSASETRHRYVAAA